MDFKAPPRWDEARFTTEAAKACALFRDERMREPVEDYVGHFEASLAVIDDLLESTVDLSTLRESGPQLLKKPSVFEVVRYLTGPPISTDDLETLIQGRVSARTLREQPDLGLLAVNTVLEQLDRRRFPWVAENREPTEAERNTAAISTAALIASRKVLTARANDGKNVQERLVKDTLIARHFEGVASRRIHMLSEAPERGQFCGESPLGPKRADIVVRLWDGRVMPIECKVSNSATNSVKRLNDAVLEATVWVKKFGDAQVVPAAVLAGVFKTRNLLDAQASGLTIWWSHDLGQMTKWITQTR